MPALAALPDRPTVMAYGGRMVEQGSWQSPRQPQPWGAPGAVPAYGPHPGAATLSRGRPWLAALVAVLTEVVIIAAAVNQAVAKHLQNFSFDHGTSFAGLSARSVLVYRWRVSPMRGDNAGGFHEWYRELLTLALLLVLTALLVALFVRGAVTFWKALFGTWFTVVVATCIATALGSLVTVYSPGSRLAKGTVAIFFAINGTTVFAGLVLGLIVALVTALVATVTRRDAVAPVAAPVAAESDYVPPDAPPPYYGDPGSGSARTAPGRDEPQWRSRPDPRADAATTALPHVQHAEPRHPEPQHTEAMPAGDEQDDSTRSTVRLPRPDSGDQPTSAYQVPPEDERR